MTSSQDLSTTTNYENNFLLLSTGTIVSTTSSETTNVSPNVPLTTNATSSFTGIIYKDYNGFSSLLSPIYSQRVFAINPSLIPNATFTSSVSSGMMYSGLFDILTFSHDGVSPLQYTGSTVSQRGCVCYDISLLNVVLPNTQIKTGSGGLIAYYPYIYVQLKNVSASMGYGKNVLYSNNRNATNALFRCAVSDTSNPSTSTYIKLTSNGATQTVKF